MVSGLGDPRLDPAVLLRNRELIAQRLAWPAGALADCLALEAEFPAWILCWTGDAYLAAPARPRFAWHRFTRPSAGEMREVLALCPSWDRTDRWASPGGWV
jgi:hypothetical protein